MMGSVRTSKDLARAVKNERNDKLAPCMPLPNMGFNYNKKLQKLSQTGYTLSNAVHSCALMCYRGGVTHFIVSSLIL